MALLMKTRGLMSMNSAIGNDLLATCSGKLEVLASSLFQTILSLLLRKVFLNLSSG
jgi:hypothetical protein